MGTRGLSTTFLHAGSKNGKWLPRTARFQEATSSIVSKGYPATSKLSVHVSFSRKIPLESSPMASGTRVCRVWPLWSEPTVRSALFFFANKLEWFKPEHQKALKDKTWPRKPCSLKHESPRTMLQLGLLP